MRVKSPCFNTFPSTLERKGVLKIRLKFTIWGHEIAIAGSRGNTCTLEGIARAPSWGEQTVTFPYLGPSGTE